MFSRKPTGATAWRCCTRGASWRWAARPSCGPESAGTWWCSNRAKRGLWHRESKAVSASRPRPWMAACAWKSPTGTASSQKWWRPFRAPSNPWACISRRSKTCSYAKPGRALTNFFLPAGADRDVLGDLLHHLDHRGPPRRVSVVHAGIARAPNQPGIGQDSGLGDAGMDSRTHLPGVRPSGGGPHRPDGTPPRGGRHLSDLIYADRARLRDRLEDGIHFRVPRHHEPATGADVDGIGIALPVGHRAWMDQGRHVGESADLFDLAVEPRVADAERHARRHAEPG